MLQIKGKDQNITINNDAINMKDYNNTKTVPLEENLFMIVLSKLHHKDRWWECSKHEQIVCHWYKGSDWIYLSDLTQCQHLLNHVKCSVNHLSGRKEIILFWISKEQHGDVLKRSYEAKKISLLKKDYQRPKKEKNMHSISVRNLWVVTTNSSYKIPNWHLWTKKKVMH